MSKYSELEIESQTEIKPAFCESWLRPVLIYSVPLIFALSTFFHQTWWTNHALTMLGLTYALFIIMLLIFHCLIDQLEERRKWYALSLLSWYALLNCAFMLVMAGTANYLSGGPVVDSPIFALFLSMLVAPGLGYVLQLRDGRRFKYPEQVYWQAVTNAYLKDRTVKIPFQWLIAASLICLFLYLVVLPFPALVEDFWPFLILILATLLSLPVFAIHLVFIHYYGTLRMNLLFVATLVYQLFWVLAFVFGENIESVGVFAWMFMHGVPVYVVYLASAVVFAYQKLGQQTEAP